MLLIFLSLLFEAVLADHQYYQTSYDCTYVDGVIKVSTTGEKTVVDSCTATTCSKDVAPTTTYSCQLKTHGAAAFGEPHFRMWTGDDRDAWFDYQGACDLVLVHNPKLSTGRFLNIHIRTTFRVYFLILKMQLFKLVRRFWRFRQANLAGG